MGDGADASPASGSWRAEGGGRRACREVKCALRWLTVQAWAVVLRLGHAVPSCTPGSLSHEQPSFFLFYFLFLFLLLLFLDLLLLLLLSPLLLPVLVQGGGGFGATFPTTFFPPPRCTWRTRGTGREVCFRTKRIASASRWMRTLAPRLRTVSGLLSRSRGRRLRRRRRSLARLLLLLLLLSFVLLLRGVWSRLVTEVGT